MAYQGAREVPVSVQSKNSPQPARGEGKARAGETAGRENRPVPKHAQSKLKRSHRQITAIHTKDFSKMAGDELNYTPQEKLAPSTNKLQGQKGKERG